jgi:hypothetical protein
MIKINSNRRANFEQQDVQDLSASRPRYLSLEDGLPEREHKSFPSWKDYAEGRYVKADPTKSHINIAQLENNIDFIMNGSIVNPGRNKRPSQAKDSREAHSQPKEKHVSPPHHTNRLESSIK